LHVHSSSGPGLIYNKESAEQARSEMADWELAQAKAAAATGKKIYHRKENPALLCICFFG